MKKQARIREIKLNIENEFVLNLITYLVRKENYVFVGNEHEIWLENLSHPKVQLIYINHQKEMTVGHATYIFQKSKIVSKQIKRKFFLSRVRTLVLNTCEFDAMIEDEKKQHLAMINIKNAQEAHQNKRLSYFFPAIVHAHLNVNLVEIVQTLQSDSKRQANHVASLSQHKVKPAVINHIYLILLSLFFVFLWLRTREVSATFVAIHYGATYSPLIVAGEYWRLMIAAFMHLDLMHFMFNAVFIYRFGTLVENVFGKWRMIMIILISALTASLFSFALSTNFSVGASGVAYGFLGVLVFLGFEMRRTFMPLLKQMVIPILVISVIFSLFMTNIDHWGHLGGFLGGFFAATIVGVPKVKPFLIRSILSLATLAILLSGLWLSGVNLTENTNFDNFNRRIMFEYRDLGMNARAEELNEIFFGTE